MIQTSPSGMKHRIVHDPGHGTPGDADDEIDMIVPKTLPSLPVRGTPETTMRRRNAPMPLALDSPAVAGTAYATPLSNPNKPITGMSKLRQMVPPR